MPQTPQTGKRWIKGLSRKLSVTLYEKGRMTQSRVLGSENRATRHKGLISAFGYSFYN